MPAEVSASGDASAKSTSKSPQRSGSRWRLIREPLARQRPLAGVRFDHAAPLDDPELVTDLNRVRDNVWANTDQYRLAKCAGGGDFGVLDLDDNVRFDIAGVTVTRSAKGDPRPAGWFAGTARVAQPCVRAG